MMFPEVGLVHKYQFEECVVHMVCDLLCVAFGGRPSWCL